eukprot:scaffold4058_cov257-Pinguiococcus_pyrenoidosus.AAC.5
MDDIAMLGVVPCRLRELLTVARDSNRLSYPSRGSRLGLVSHAVCKQNSSPSSAHVVFDCCSRSQWRPRSGALPHLNMAHVGIDIPVQVLRHIVPTEGMINHSI